MKFLRHTRGRLLAWRTQRWLDQKEGLYDWCVDNTYFHIRSHVGGISRRWSLDDDDDERVVATPREIEEFMQMYEDLEYRLPMLEAMLRG